MQLSVVIPVYNVAQYLGKCIDSVLASEYDDYEIILVDDGATDGICPELCDRYAAEHPERIRVIHQPNQGLGGARNTGLDAATGEYVFFVDSDDTLVPRALSMLSEQIEKTHADIYSFNLYSHDGNGHGQEIQVSRNYPEPFTLKQHPEFLYALPAACARIWKRSLFLQSGIRFPSRVLYEDIRTSVKLFALADSIVTIPQALYEYLARPGSIMRSDNLQRNREILDAFEDLNNWFTQQGLKEQYAQQLCRLAVDHIVLAATVRVARLDPKSKLLKEFEQFMQSNFPNYWKNTTIGDLPVLHKVLLVLIRHKRYRLVKLLFQLKDGR